MKSNTTVPEDLADSWQRSPQWWRAGAPRFEPPLTVDEIAGLATLADVESVLIRTERRGLQTEYRIQHGPFESSTLTTLGDRDWTLLVRDIDRHLPELAELWRYFEWLADYRRADIMVSIAAPGGSVGPHRDSYDVFLVQGTGERTWQLAAGDTAKEVPDHPLRLAHPEAFTETFTATPGQILYVPPGYIHHGVADSLCTTWSFGLQAPLIADIAAIAGVSVAHEIDERLRDASLPRQSRPGEIPASALSATTCSAAQHSAMLDALGILLSTPKPGFELDPTSQRDNTILHPWTRLYWRVSGQTCIVYCNGQVLPGHRSRVAVLERLSGDRSIDPANDPELVHWLHGCAAF